MGKPMEVGIGLGLGLTVARMMHCTPFYAIAKISKLYFLWFIYFLKCLFSSSLKWRRQVLNKWTQRTSSSWLPLPLSTSSTILTKLSPWSLLELLCLDSLDFYVIAKLLIVFPSYEIYALCAYLRPINLGRR